MRLTIFCRGSGHLRSRACLQSGWRGLACSCSSTSSISGSLRSCQWQRTRTAGSCTCGRPQSSSGSIGFAIFCRQPLLCAWSRRRWSTVGTNWWRRSGICRLGTRLLLAKCTAYGTSCRRERTRRVRELVRDTYAIEPHVKPTRRWSLSDIERADGAPSPSVLSLTGMLLSRRLHLNRAAEELK